MRQFLIIGFLFVAVFATSAITTFGQKQMYFSSGDQCVEALQNGTANFYRPTYFKLHKAASAGEEVRGLESDACALMLTVKGYQWVAQKEGEKMVFKGLEIHRRYDCGNPIKDIRYPKTEDVPPPPVERVKCPEGTYESEAPGVCIAEKEKIVTKVEVKTEIKEIYPCPAFTEARYGSKGLGARMPSAMELLVAAGKGAPIAAVMSNEDRAKAALLSAGLSAADTTVTNMLIPDYNVLYLEGTFPISVRKGKQSFSPDGSFILEWKNNQIIGRLPNGIVCFAGAVQKSFNTGSIAIVKRNGVKQSIPIKTQTTKELPDRPGTNGVTSIPLPIGNNGPGGGTITNPLPTQPRRNSYAAELGLPNPATGRAGVSNELPGGEAAQPGFRWVTLADGRRVQVKLKN